MTPFVIHHKPTYQLPLPLIVSIRDRSEQIAALFIGFNISIDGNVLIAAFASAQCFKNGKINDTSYSVHCTPPIN